MAEYEYRIWKGRLKRVFPFLMECGYNMLVKSCCFSAFGDGKIKLPGYKWIERLSFDFVEQEHGGLRM